MWVLMIFGEPARCVAPVWRKMGRDERSMIQNALRLPNVEPDAVTATASLALAHVAPANGF